MTSSMRSGGAGHNPIEQELRDSQARLAGIIASAMDAIVSVDEDQRIILFNKAAEEVFGYPAEQVIGSPLDLLIPARYQAIHRQHIRNFGETGETNRSMGRLNTLYGLHTSGREFPIEATISQIQLSGGKLFTVILRDITERVQVEEKLRQSEASLRVTFEQAPVGIAQVGLDGHVLWANRKMSQISGYTLEELQAKRTQEITFPPDVEPEQRLIERVLAGEIDSYNLEKRYICKSGLLTWVNLTASLVRDLSGAPTHFIKVIEDISSRKKAETDLAARNDEIKTMTQQLWQTAKLATMGELAASIAHELNNPLAILSMRIELLASKIPDSFSERKDLEIMEHEVERMASLVSNLLQFSRSGQRQISSLNICEEIDRTLELVHNHLIHRRINVQRDCAPGVPMLQADRQQMRQLFLNLFSNASDAMPQGGTLTVRVGPEHGDGRVRIEVEDTGAGIAPENIARILEPFYTSKPEGKGTGLGLAICKRIIEEHRGTIQITSPGINQGTKIQISLPRANGAGPTFLEDAEGL